MPAYGGLSYKGIKKKLSGARFSACTGQLYSLLFHRNLNSGPFCPSRTPSPGFTDTKVPFGSLAPFNR